MPAKEPSAHRTAGVDIDAADSGLRQIVARLRGTWPGPGAPGAVTLDFGYFANVIDIGGGMGLAISTDGVGSKSMIAHQLGRYDTIGIDCVAGNVNDVLCVGARPLSMVDYIAIDHAEPRVLAAIAEGLAEGAKEAGISICGGEIAQLRDMVRGFDLAGTAIGTVPLDRVLTGRDAAPGDVVIGLFSSGIHANGLTLARHVFFERAGVGLDRVFPELGVALGEELLRPTRIYVREILAVLEAVPGVKALVNITGDGLLNLPRIEAAVGFRIDALPAPPAIFGLIQALGGVDIAEMYEVYNMGVGFCIVAAEADADRILQILAAEGRAGAAIIGEVVADPDKGVHLPQFNLIGHGKHFRRA
jgi:phosphoribosylformylglycinamidine cyclo-ligase